LRGEGCKSFALAKKILAEKRLSDASYAVVEKTTGSRLAALGRHDRRVFHDLHHRRQLPDRSAGE
jgi:hypothetical protein